MAHCRSFGFVTIANAVLLAILSNVVVGMFGPIGTDAPALPGGTVANTQPPNSIFQDFSEPYPTNDWWIGYATGNGSNATVGVGGPFPYQSTLREHAIAFGVSTNRSFDGVSILQPNQTDWAVGFSEHDGNLEHHKVLSWDSQSVTLQYFTRGRTMTSYMVPGSPYLTFVFDSATPKFTSAQGNITNFGGFAVKNGSATTLSANKFSVKNHAGTYLIYSLNGSITLSASSTGNITAASPFSGVLRVAKLNETDHEELLDAHVSAYPTGVETDYDFYGDTGILRFTWTVQGSPSDLLMLTWPHHRKSIVNGNLLSRNSLSYLTAKGHMYPALGNVWEMQYALPTISWNAPRDPDSSCVDEIISGLEYDIANLPSVVAPVDFYFTAQNLATVSRLALIADHVGRPDLIQPVIQYLEAMVDFYYDPISKVLPAYETGWGGIIRGDAYNDTAVEFGNAFYNDHHFHYGYFLVVGAVIAKNHPAWLQSHGYLMTWLLRDIVNPSKDDPYFAVTRHRDFFAGHSWASGIANGPNGATGSRNQESTGEAVNAYYGAMLWATVIGNRDIQNYARLLLATEQLAAQTYWHLYIDADPEDRDQPYPEQALRNLVTIGNVNDDQAGAWLFWGNQRVEISSIQILPPTPVNEYLYDPDWAQSMYNYTQNETHNSTILDQWKALVYLAYSQVDPREAVLRSNNLTSWGPFSSYSNHIYFLSTRPQATGAGICDGFPKNPVGTFFIRSQSTGKYVGLKSLPNLVPDTKYKSNAAQFKFSYTPNAGTIQETTTGLYVTANATNPPTFSLAATSQVSNTSAQVFLVRRKIGAAKGVYSFLAAANQNYVVLDNRYSILNSSTTNTSTSAPANVSAVANITSHGLPMITSSGTNKTSYSTPMSVSAASNDINIRAHLTTPSTTNSTGVDALLSTSKPIVHFSTGPAPMSTSSATYNNSDTSSTPVNTSTIPSNATSGMLIANATTEADSEGFQLVSW